MWKMCHTVSNTHTKHLHLVTFRSCNQMHCISGKRLHKLSQRTITETLWMEFSTPSAMLTITCRHLSAFSVGQSSPFGTNLLDYSRWLLFLTQILGVVLIDKYFLQRSSASTVSPEQNPPCRNTLPLKPL